MKTENLHKALLVFLSLYFLFFTFLGITWGSPYFFHPDERNIASSISQLRFDSLNPHFFAYGQLPIYVVFVVGSLLNFTSGLQGVLFEQAIILGRLISAFLSIALVFLIYKTTETLANKNAALLSLVFSATSVAFLQFNHYATFEIWLSFLYLACCFSLLKFLKTNKRIFLFIAAATFGISLGLKLSSATFVIVPLITILFDLFSEKLTRRKLVIFIKNILAFLLLTAAFYLLTSPFNLIDSQAFINSMKYESSVATGSLPVFYTGSFYNELPIVFQVVKIFPFLLNPVLSLIFIPFIIYLTYTAIKKKNKHYAIFLVALFTLIIFPSFIFTKWTRYVIPAIPFIYILCAISINILVNKKIFNYLLVFFTITGIIFSFSFIKTVRLSEDTRIEAVKFATKNIPSNSKILTEVYDLGIVPFNPHYSNISLFNFYDLDNGLSEDELKIVLKESQYIILPSPRISYPRLSKPGKFPVGNKFYSNLFSQELDFEKIYETPCDIFCRITYFDPIEGFEQTTNIFDRPTVYIFKKVSK